MIFAPLHLSKYFGAFAAVTVALWASPARAFDAAEVQTPTLTLKIGDVGPIDARAQQPVSVPVTLSNIGEGVLQGTLEIGLVDGWKATPATSPFQLAAGQSKSIPIIVLPGPKTYAALYPLHANVYVQDGTAHRHAHAVRILSVKTGTASKPQTTLPLLNAPKRGALALDRPGIYAPKYFVGRAAIQNLPIGWTGSDERTGTDIRLLDMVRGDGRHAIAVHEPWRIGAGEAMLDYRLVLPPVKPLALEFATAIRDSSGTEPQSDGVEFSVWADDGSGWKRIWNRFSAAKKWQLARVDLSAYGGKTISLRLQNGPGPNNNTAVDQAYWAEPAIISGVALPIEGAALKQVRRTRALNRARAAARGRVVPWTWRLSNSVSLGRESAGAAVVPGPHGLADAYIAFVAGRREVVFEGFEIVVSGRALGAARTGLRADKVLATWQRNGGTLRHQVTWNGRALSVAARLWAQNGALRLAFSMPNAARDRRGEPRFTRLAIGAASQRAKRVYAGFGNVLQNPGTWSLEGNGFRCSTRHIGIDFSGGLSLVQATDIFPDAFESASTAKRYALVTHHDATFSFFPSARGAFAAARAYRVLSGFHPAAGVKNIIGRMCLDQWGGDYAQAAQELERAARYGVTNAVFVKHVWQRWGYDYRLPDIYPPSGNFTAFQQMVRAAKKHGILFAPHDNYIDFYPDASGFSYQHIFFNEDGTPQLAWFNPGPNAQSYRWRPTAFLPRLEANLKQIKSGFSPTSYFVDVFSAIPPLDFYDQQGRFFPKTVSSRAWGQGFDRIRAILGQNAPTISEAGHDALIGHLDAGQSDHAGWVPPNTPPASGGDAGFRWQLEASDGERVPWHDMATHGSFVLLGGGLGNRYASGADPELHGYGSDDYLSLTVLGGRNPMADGPFNRRAVMTYWLLHNLCGRLARSEMLEHQFIGDDIHRQQVKFSSGTVTVNRGRSDWRVGGHSLPQYGFLAQAGTGTDAVSADISRRGGVVSAFARSGKVLFADARPPLSGERSVQPRVISVDDLGNRRFRLRLAWDIQSPAPTHYQPFVHFVDSKQSTGEGIAFQASTSFDSARLAQIGTIESTAEATLPADAPEGATFQIRLGLYNSQDGARFSLSGPNDGNNRARVGQVVWRAGKVLYQPEAPDPTQRARLKRLNVGGKMLDVGAVQTNGAFRLNFAGRDWQLTPLPYSSAFNVTLKLNWLGAAGRKVLSAVAIKEDGSELVPIAVGQNGDDVRMNIRPGLFIFAVKLRLS